MLACRLAMMAGRIDFWNIPNELTSEQWQTWEAIDRLIGLPDKLAARLQAVQSSNHVHQQLPELSHHFSVEAIERMEARREATQPVRDLSDLSRFD